MEAPYSSFFVANLGPRHLDSNGADEKEQQQQEPCHCRRHDGVSTVRGPMRYWSTNGKHSSAELSLSLRMYVGAGRDIFECVA